MPTSIERHGGGIVRRMTDFRESGIDRADADPRDDTVECVSDCAACATVTVETHPDATPRTLPFSCDIDMSNIASARHCRTNVVHSSVDRC
ncbi:hypothetical protein HT749_21530 [Burkholderia cepacia]|uniref:hypothetical protein n=1 Tax=Burkholderia cepacia TaxID=292 RepID=UPI00157AA0EB|nr:hypothetical protein [Burkholderia cepacia]NTX45983.1 hypothetical protein [Burkholderia cepacia]